MLFKNKSFIVTSDVHPLIKLFPIFYILELVNTDAIDVVKLRAGIQNDCEEFFADNTDFIRDVVGGDSLVIDGVKVPVISSFDFFYKIGRKGLVSTRSAIEWIEILTKDMNDPERFWSESYWVLLVTLKNKFELKGTKK